MFIKLIYCTARFKKHFIICIGKEVRMARRTESMKELLEDIKTSAIHYERFKTALIASDLRIYTRREYDAIMTSPMPSQVGRSPYTRELFSKAPFPFQFSALENVVAATSIEKILQLATCPVSGQLMKEPKIVYLIDKNKPGAGGYLIICDDACLEYLPKNLKVQSQRDYTELKDFLDSSSGRLARLASFDEHTVDEARWYNVLKEIQLKFKPTETAAIDLVVATDEAYKKKDTAIDFSASGITFWSKKALEDVSRDKIVCTFTLDP